MTSEHRIKVIFDTNIWISYLIGRQLGNLTELLSSRKIELVLSEQLLTELTEVTGRKRFQKYFSEQKVNELLKLMDILGTNYEVTEYPHICRDSKDNFLLGLIRVSRAHLLVTGDQDLLELKMRCTFYIIVSVLLLFSCRTDETTAFWFKNEENKRTGNIKRETNNLE